MRPTRANTTGRASSPCSRTWMPPRPRLCFAAADRLPNIWYQAHWRRRAFSLHLSYSRRKKPDFRSVGIDRYVGRLCVQEVRRGQRCADRLECARRDGAEEFREIARGAFVGKGQRAFGDPEILFDKPADAAEVLARVANEACRCQGRHNNEGHAKAHLVATLRSGFDGRSFVIVPAAPVVPRDYNGGAVPV